MRTFVSFGPFSRRMASSLVTILPTKGLPSMLTTLSPASNPALSAGAFFITFCTCSVSSRMLNSIPTPENEPFSSSLAACMSLAVM